MPSSLPSEILDLIVDHLRDEPVALKACCVASKSWVSRTRRHLFACVEFHAEESTLQSWMKVFPDPSNSPAHYARSLLIRDSWIFTAASMNARAWICAFHRVVHMGLDVLRWYGGQGSLVPLHGLSPILQTLSIFCTSIPLSETLSLICSFPSLENLTFMTLVDGRPDGWIIPPTSPKFTGTLSLWVGPRDGTRPTLRHLLDLPGGLHFSKISVDFPIEDAESTISLVSGCFDTLESLCINCIFSELLEMPPPFDLSKATKLKDVKFYLAGPNIRWIVMTLKTVGAKSLRQISIHTVAGFHDPIEETVRQEWQDLDRLLVELWTSRSIRPSVVYTEGEEEANLTELVVNLLPELASRGAVDALEDKER